MCQAPFPSRKIGATPIFVGSAPRADRERTAVSLFAFAITNWDTRVSLITDLEMILPGIDFLISLIYDADQASMVVEGGIQGRFIYEESDIILINR